MKKILKKIATVLIALALGSPALGQSNVKQSGNVTIGHVPWWVSSGVIGDSGSSADSKITSFGVTNNGGNGICVNSDHTTAAGWNSLCLGVQTDGPASISLQNYGTASPQNLNLSINGFTTSILPEVVSITSFGAVGNFNTDNTAAIQAAFDYAFSINRPVYVPCAPNVFYVSASINTHGVNFDGGGSCARILTDKNVSIFYTDLSEVQIYYGSYKNVTFIGNVSGTRTSNNGYEVRGGGNNMNLPQFIGITCLGTYRCLYNNATGGTDFWTIDKLRTANFVLDTDRAIEIQNGSGTGLSIVNSTMIIASYCIIFDGTGGAIVGDIVISSNQCNAAGGGGTAAIYFSPTASYRSNIQIVGNNWGDIPISINATNYIGLRMYGNGMIGNTFSGTAVSSGDFSLDTPQRNYGRFKNAIASTVSDLFLGFTMPSGVFDAVVVEVTASGLVQGIGTQLRTSRYTIAQNGNCGSITATQMDTFTAGVGSPFTFTTSLSTCTMNFTLNFPGGTTTNSSIQYSIKVTGGGSSLSGYDANML